MKQSLSLLYTLSFLISLTGKVQAAQQAMAVVSRGSPQYIRPFPPAAGSSYTFKIEAAFRIETEIMSPVKNSLACDYQLGDVTRCANEDYFIVEDRTTDTVQLNFKKTGKYFLLPSQIISNCSSIDSFCERLYATNPQHLSVGLGYEVDHVKGIFRQHVFITLDGKTTHLKYLVSEPADDPPQAMAVVSPSSPQDIRPFPPTAGGSYTFEPGAALIDETQIMSPVKNGFACDYDAIGDMMKCASDDYFIVENKRTNTAQLNIKRTGKRFLLPKQINPNCTSIGSFCERLYAIDPKHLSIGIGYEINGNTRVEGYHFYIIRDGRTEDLAYLKAIVPLDLY